MYNTSRKPPKGKKFEEALYERLEKFSTYEMGNAVKGKFVPLGYFTSILKKKGVSHGKRESKNIYV